MIAIHPSYEKKQTPYKNYYTSVTVSISPGMVLCLCLNSLQHREASRHYQHVQTTQPLEAARLTRLYVLFFDMSICAVCLTLFSIPRPRLPCC